MLARPARRAAGPALLALLAAALAATGGCQNWLDQSMEPPVVNTPPYAGQTPPPFAPPAPFVPIPPIPLTPPAPPIPSKCPTMRVRVGPDRTNATLATASAYEIQVDGKTVFRAPDGLRPASVSRRGGLWRMGKASWPGQTLALLPQGDAVVTLDRTAYRGSMHLHAVGSSSYLAVNHLDLENYLAGVLARELFKDWHAETYRALAIAARTYAYYEATANPKDPRYDLWDNQASQMYGGLAAETPASLAAVRSTAGQFLMAGEPGKLAPFRAYYSSCCGGVTNPAEVLLGKNPSPALRGGVACTDCSRATFYRWPPVRLSKRDLYHAVSASFPQTRGLGGLTAIRVASEIRPGRPYWLELIGPKGKTARLLADDLRLAALRNSVPGASKLYSMNCRIVDAGSSFEFRDGQGFGHGVGLCQWGAEGKALQRWPAEKILLHYYTGAQIVRLY
ncbi:MAG: SpoIID/LytB domain-containing protein [Planctomycetota bacterium]|nr:SpoIID/LytB domain-containing protein [Planctomycetota bacterium]